MVEGIRDGGFPDDEPYPIERATAKPRANFDLAAATAGISKRFSETLKYLAQVDRNPKGHDPAGGHGRNDESPVAATSGDAPEGS